MRPSYRNPNAGSYSTNRQKTWPRRPAGGGGRSRSRSRSRGHGKRKRSRSRSTSRPRKRPRKFQDRKGKKEKRAWRGKNKEKSDKGGGDDKSKGEENYVSPDSFEQAWSGNFFLPKAIMAVTALCFSITQIPLLHTMSLGGRLKHCVNDWIRIDVGSWVKKVVSIGYKIPFKRLPVQSKLPSNPTASGPAFDILATEAEQLLEKEAIKESSHESGEYISSYFAVTKARSPGKFRPILNLKRFNLSIRKFKFKMETLAHVRDWLKKDSYCVSIDLKDAFLHVPIIAKNHKFLKFSWMGKLYKWIVLPFGLTCSPRVLTKVLKPVMAFLRSVFAILISIYLDDMLIQASSKAVAYMHGQICALVLMALGWSINWTKSNFFPSKTITHLGFDFDTAAMTIACPKTKIQDIQVLCKVALEAKYISVKDSERLLGKMESVRPSTPYAALRYRPLQKQLLSVKVLWPRDFRKPNQIIKLNSKSLHCLVWWISPAGFEGNSVAPIRELSPTVEIWSDASLQMCGAHNSRGQIYQREWSQEELSTDPHINLLEIRAAKEALPELSLPGDRVQLNVDSTTAVCYIKKQGGTHSYSLSKEACDLWESSILHNIQLLTPNWISTNDNVEADFLSRNLLDQWEVRLKADLFAQILEHFNVYPTLDAFASQETAQLARYMSWRPDSRAVARDALRAQWDPITYLFPPVPLLMKALNKVRSQEIQAILVCPRWPTAMWWTLVTELLVVPPLPLPHCRSALETVQGETVQCYLDPLVAVLISGRHSATL